MGEHTEKQFVKTEARQRCTPGEKGCGRPPQWGGAQERGRWVIYIGQFFLQVFVYLWPITWFLFPHLTCPRTLLTMRAQLFSKMDSSPEAYEGALASHIMRWCSLLFDPQGAFLHMCSVSLAPRMRNIWPLDPLLQQGLAPLCSCHDCIFKCPQETKPGYLPCVCCYSYLEVQTGSRL